MPLFSRRERKHPLLFRFLSSYLSIAILALTLAGGFSILIYSRVLHIEQERNIANSMEMAALSLRRQLDRVNDMANEISVNSEYSNQYVEQNYESEQMMMRLLRNYETLLPFEYSYYLRYSSRDAIYTGKAKYTNHVFFMYVLDEPVRAAVMDQLSQGDGIRAAGDSVIYVRNISILHTNMVLLAVVPYEEIQSYTADMIGVDSDCISLFLAGERAIGGGEAKHSAIVNDALTIGLELDIASETLAGAFTQCILILMGVALLVACAAVIQSYSSYKPIRKIASSYIDDGAENDDELAKIEKTLSHAVTAYSATEKRVSEMSFRLDEQKKMLYRQCIRQILHMGYDSEAPEALGMLGIRLLGQFSIVAAIACAPEDDAEAIENNITQLTFEDEIVFYAVQEGDRILTLINSADQTSVLSGMNMLTTLFEGNRDVRFSPIATSAAGIGTLIGEISSGASQTAIVNAEIASICDSILSAQMEEAVAGLYAMERNIDVSADAVLVNGIHSELARAIFAIAGESDKSAIGNRLTMALLAPDTDAYMREMRQCLYIFCENRKKAHMDAGQINGLVTYIDEHYGEYSMSLETLSDVFGISSRQVSNEIKAITGLSYMDYLKKVRMQKAIEKLMSTDMSVTDVGEAVGYLNISYFIRLFREYTGSTPSIYRNMKK